MFLISCHNEKPQQEKLPPEQSVPNVVDFDLDKIKQRGKLIALTRFNANSYFLYKGQPMGYEYELLNLLAENTWVWHLKLWFL
jgi:membrane-bound lytic murein transglycosylase F